MHVQHAKSNIKYFKLLWLFPKHDKESHNALPLLPVRKRISQVQFT